jgi:hypothetical protein
VNRKVALEKTRAQLPRAAIRGSTAAASSLRGGEREEGKTRAAAAAAGDMAITEVTSVSAREQSSKRSAEAIVCPCAWPGGRKCRVSSGRPRSASVDA